MLDEFSNVLFFIFLIIFQSNRILNSRFCFLFKFIFTFIRLLFVKCCLYSVLYSCIVDTLDKLKSFFFTSAFASVPKNFTVTFQNYIVTLPLCSLKQLDEFCYRRTRKVRPFEANYPPFTREARIRRLACHWLERASSSPPSSGSDVLCHDVCSQAFVGKTWFLRVRHFEISAVLVTLLKLYFY